MKQKIEIDNLIKSSLKNEWLCSPGKDFTEKVMTSLMELPASSKAYKPLLPGKILAAILCFLVIIITLIVFSPAMQSESFLNAAITDKVMNTFKTFHFNIEIPTSISYIIACFMLMLLFQAIMISKFIRKTH